MNREILQELKQYSTEPILIDRLLVSLFVASNDLVVKNNKLLRSYLIHDRDPDYKAFNFFLSLFQDSEVVFSFEVLIKLFEFVISPADKVINGAVYTPDNIKDFIVYNIFTGLLESDTSLSKATFGDISCGCGGFFYSIALELKARTENSFYTIFKRQIFGLDIEEYSIQRTKLLLSLVAISNGEDRTVFQFNLFVGNALDFDWPSHSPIIKKSGGFTSVVGNPPYVVSRNIEPEVKKHLEKWTVTKSGRPDLYIPFFEIGLKYLRTNGILGLITMNTFLKSLNGRALREYFIVNQFDLKIIDFRWEQVFRNRLTYTCICIIRKQQNPTIKYLATNPGNLSKIISEDFDEISYENLGAKRGWLLSNRELVEKIENIGKSLGKLFEIRNGFATLSNDIFLFKPIRTEEEYFVFEKEGKEYSVERGICRSAIKPNILKSVEDIDRFREQIIFPYEVCDKPDISSKQASLFPSKNSAPKIVKLFPEELFRDQFPKAYNYLKIFKKQLEERDKGGAKDYKAWYAYGRNQALTHSGYKLLFPYLTNKPRFIFCDEKDLLFYNGFAILSDDKEKLLAVQKILQSKIFELYIKQISKPYSSDYYSLGKNYIKNFGVVSLTDEQKLFLLNGHTKKEIEDLLLELYGLTEIIPSKKLL